jgi:hypothetical protein
MIDRSIDRSIAGSDVDEPINPAILLHLARSFGFSKAYLS